MLSNHVGFSLDLIATGKKRKKQKWRRRKEVNIATNTLWPVGGEREEQAGGKLWRKQGDVQIVQFIRRRTLCRKWNITNS